MPPAPTVAPADEDAGVLPTRVLATRGADLLAPVEAEPSAAPTEPVGEVVPQRVRKRAAPVTKTKPSRRLQPGDLICGQCGEGNPPVRKFCSRCGEALTSAEVVRAPWYRRLMFWRREPTAHEAGARPGRGGVKASRGVRVSTVYRKLRNGLAAVLLVVGILVVVAPPVRGLLVNPLDNLKDRTVRWYQHLTDNYIEVPPENAVAVPATAVVKGHPAKNVIDSTDSFWAAPFAKSARPAVRLTFGKKDASNFYDVVFVTGGASGKDKDAFLYPKRLRFTYGSTNSEVCELAEPSGKPQRCDLEQAVTFRSVTITVLSVFEKKGLDRVALQDVQFKRKKGD